MASDWNLAIESLLDSDLTLEEMKLGLAIIRETLGFNTRERAVGQKLLRDWTGFHGRSFDRAREGLTVKWVVQVTPGKGGRGNRDSYSLLLDDVLGRYEKLAQERAIEAKGDSPAQERTIIGDSPAERPAESSASARARKEDGGKNNRKNLSDNEQGFSSNATNESEPVDPAIVDVLGAEVVDRVVRANLSPDVRDSVLRAKVKEAEELRGRL
jgi:hypothetical protein